MEVIQKTGEFVQVSQVEKPVVTGGTDVVIRVVLSGLCRTDVYAAQGLIEKVKNPLVLGHEFSGIITEVGNSVSNVSVGDRVTVMPVIPCGECETCKNGDTNSCPYTTMLGIDYDGSFAEYIKVPAINVYKLPDSVSFMMGAYMEPVAASYSVIKTGIKPSQTGIVCGSNRISQLTKHVLDASDFQNVNICEDSSSLAENSLDFAIETLADEENMANLIRAVKPQGIIVIKSRKYPPVGLVFNDIVRKELKLIGTNYGSFEECIQLAATGKLDGVKTLWGDVHKLESFNEVFSGDEEKKQFFSSCEEDVWNR